MSGELLLVTFAEVAPGNAALRRHHRHRCLQLDRPRFGRHVLPCVVEVSISESAPGLPSGEASEFRSSLDHPASRPERDPLESRGRSRKGLSRCRRWRCRRVRRASRRARRGGVRTRPGRGSRGWSAGGGGCTKPRCTRSQLPLPGRGSATSGGRSAPSSGSRGTSRRRRCHSSRRRYKSQVELLSGTASTQRGSEDLPRNVLVGDRLLLPC